MAEPPSTSDLLLLIAGLHKLKNPDTTADFGEDYYLNPKVDQNERSLRESLPNPLYLNSPEKAWSDVRFRDWLIATLFGNLAGKKHDFKAITEPVLSSKDLLAKTFEPHMAGATDTLIQMLNCDSGERTYFSTLTVGISKQTVDTKDVFLFGAGLRRRVELALKDSGEALKVELEFFVPFYILPNSDHDADKLSKSFVRSICAGIVITSDKGVLGTDEDKKELVGMRFNLRIPFKIESKSKKIFLADELKTEFGTPDIKRQRKVKDGINWEEFTNWKKFVENFFDKDVIYDLLNSPAGPLLAEKISDEAGVKDIILKQSKRDEIKKNLGRAKEDLADTMYLLKHVYEWQPPDKDDPNPDTGSRKLGTVLASLGFMTGTPAGDGEFDYEFGIAEGLTVWSVLDRILGELDGFPLYASGLESKTDKPKRIVAALASQPDVIDRAKHFFGLAIAAYNILLNPVSKKDSAARDGDKDEPSIILTEDNFTDDESILIEPEEQEEENAAPVEEARLSAPEKEGEKGRVEVMLHLGKWFSGETLDDNWLLRLLPKSDDPGQQRVPLPGIRLLPIKWVPSTDRSKATFSWTLVVDLVSLGIDIQGTTKDGLKFIDGFAGYFGLGAVELRLAFKLSLEDIYQKKGFFDRVALGVGIKLKDLRLSLGLSDEEKKKREDAKKKNQKVEKGDEIIEGLQELLSDDWVVLPKTDTKPAKRDVKTRLSAKKKDKFSISVGYLTPLKDGSSGTLDVQLYDSDGNRGEMVLIPIDRFGEPIYLKQIGIALKGVENIQLGEGLPDTAQLTVSITGGIRVPGFELGFIGATLTFQLNDASKFKFTLDGLDVSIKIGDVIISGSFMKVGVEFAGSLTISIPKGSFSAMGFYGSLVLFKMSHTPGDVAIFNGGNVPEKMLAKLTEKNVTPITSNPVGFYPGGGWELTATDDKKYLIMAEDDDYYVLRPEKTFFIYVTLSAASGTGIPLGPIQITGFVGGFGYNRRIKVPTIENVAAFPLVQIVMGKGGYQSEDETFELHNQLAKPVEDPAAVLEKMKKSLVPDLGQYFACAGLRFTINGTIDCFALAIVQWGDDTIEISLMGLARFRLPRDTTARAICYVELLILMTIKPSEGTFKLQALLSSNSWVINTDCKLTGGFALFIWFDGEHKGDVVFTIGGYHPRFRRPDHYPIVPRLGLNWRVNDNLSIKGGCYFALTPSCGMVGAKLEAYFHSGRISAWFTAYLDVIINWSPLYFEAELGISLKVKASFFLFDIDVTISASIEMWGPPVGGIAHIDLTVCKFDIDFGPARPKKGELIDKWETFCHNFLNLKGQDRRAVNAPVVAFPVIQPNLGAGRNNLNNLSTAKRKDAQPKPEDEIWKVRADELELAATAAVPVTTMNVGKVKPADVAEGIQARSTSGRSMMVKTPVKLESDGLDLKKSTNKLGIHPMGRALDSVLNVTIVQDASVVEAVELSGWTMEEERGSLPAALWEPGVPNMRPAEPTAKMVDGCITGLKRLKPPRGVLGKQAIPPPIEWHKLVEGRVPQSSTTQQKPSPGRDRNVEPLVIQKQANQKKVVAALATIGFPLGWQEVPQAQIRFRELQANPLSGEVAA